MGAPHGDCRTRVFCRHRLRHRGRRWRRDPRQDGTARLPLSVLATTIVALAFEPVRRWLEAGAVRIFIRGGASPYDVLSQFSQTVTGGYATEELPARMAKLLAEGRTPSGPRSG